MAGKRIHGLIAVAALLTLMLGAGQREMFAQDSPNGGGGELLRERCTVCHDLRRVEKEYGTYDRARWERVVERMIKLGARLNAEERAMLVDYLRTQQTALKK